MYAVIGLGNPGPEYAGTRHNVGFAVLDRIAKDAAAKSWKEKGGSLFQQIEFAGERVLLLEPQLYMNRSGEAAQVVLNFFKIKPANIIVVYDELDLDPGVLRIRFGGGAAGHKGVASLINVLGSEEFYRVRIGIGHPRRAPESRVQDVSDWVLLRPEKDEKALIDVTVEKAAEAVSLLINEGLEAAQRRLH